jgi:hypothetical protein
MSPLRSSSNPSLDSRRFAIRIGSFSIFAIGGPVIFGSMGLGSLIYYIVSLAIFRLFSAVVVSEISKNSPQISLFLYRISPLMMVASAILPWVSSNIIYASIFLMPILSGFYIGTFWVIHFDVSQCLGLTTEDFQFTEVVGTVLGAVLGVSLTIIAGTEGAAAAGGAFVLLGAFVPLDVASQELGVRLTEWSDEADKRPKEQIHNGLKIVAGVAVLNWCCLSTLRIETLIDAPPLMGIVSLGFAISASEAIGYLGTRHIEIQNGWFKIVACAFAITGFSMMIPGGPIWTAAGYWFASISSRVYWRVFDRKVARAALRGLGGRPGPREIRRYTIFLACCPLLTFPTLLPYIGILSVVVLMTTRNGILPNIGENS